MRLFFLREGKKFTLYSLETGKSVTDFLSRLKKTDKGEFARIMGRLTCLSDQGASRKLNEFNLLGNGLYEAKTKGGARVIFFYGKNEIVICACGFLKKSMKTPSNVIKTALGRKSAYEKHVADKKPFEIVKSKSQKEPRRKP